MGKTIEAEISKFLRRMAMKPGPAIFMNVINLISGGIKKRYARIKSRKHKGWIDDFEP